MHGNIIYFISKVYNMVGGSEYILKGFNQNDNKVLISYYMK